MTTAILFSGGLDSAVLWRLLPDLPCLFVRMGQPYQDEEEQSIHDLQALCRANRKSEPIVAYVEGIDVSAMVRDDGHIPLRNLHLAATAASYGFDRILIGAVAGEASPDKTAKFLRHTSRALSTAAGRRVRVVAPLRRHTKAEWVRLYKRASRDEFDMRVLLQTRSCHAASGADSGVSCGRCRACFRRWVAMTLNDIEEPYAVDPWTDPYVNDEWANLRRGLARCPVREWPKVLRNNLDAHRALARVR